MARMNSMRWSGHSQDLLVRAVADPDSVAALLAKGIPESHRRPWVAHKDVSGLFCGQLRGSVEGRAHANA